MTTWESGRESALLDAIIDGRKTIEGRLNKDKFSRYRVGDLVWLRSDYRDASGALHDGATRQVLVKIIGIRHYTTFLALAEAEGFRRVIPSAHTAQQAADEYNQFYSTLDQARYGVLAIEIMVIKATS